MAEKGSHFPSERTPQGHEIYVGSMEKSADAKFEEILPWVKEGVIIDWGAGAGPMTDRLSRRFPGSKVIAVDNSHEMIEHMKRRFFGRENVEVIYADVTEFIPPYKIDTSLHISNLHEGFSLSTHKS